MGQFAILGRFCDLKQSAYSLQFSNSPLLKTGQPQVYPSVFLLNESQMRRQVLCAFDKTGMVPLKITF